MRPTVSVKTCNLNNIQETCTWQAHTSTLLTFWIWQLRVQLSYRSTFFISSSTLHIYPFLWGLFKLTQGHLNSAFWPPACVSYTAKVNWAIAPTSIKCVYVCVCPVLLGYIELSSSSQKEVKSQMLLVWVVTANIWVKGGEKTDRREKERVCMWVTRLEEVHPHFSLSALD